MKLKINKACDLSSISVLPPQSRRLGAVSGGLESSSTFGRNQTALQLRSQQPQQSQQSFSQPVFSQQGLFSQFSQNSQDEVLTDEKLGSQEKENSVKRTSCLPPARYSREDSQMMVSRTSTNLMRKWSSQENKHQVSEEFEHRIGMIDTSLNRLGMILDSVQSDIMQVNKSTKEVVLEIESVRQKLIFHDDSLQLMNRGQEEIKSHLDMGLKSLGDQLNQNKNQESLREILSLLSALADKIDSQMLKLRSDLSKDFNEKIQAITDSMKISRRKQTTPTTYGPKAAICSASPQELQFLNNKTKHSKSLQTSFVSKVEMGRWTSVKQELATIKVGNPEKRSSVVKVSPKQLEEPCTVVIESDEEIDGGLSCLLKEKGTDYYTIEAAEEESARILRKARRRKRKHGNTIIIN